MTSPLSPESIAHARALRAKGLLWMDIARIVGVPLQPLYRHFHAPQWPKLVTRIGEDGSAELVRVP